MSKKLVFGVLAVLGLIAVSQTPAAAASCLSWKTIGGSSMCVAWATKGILAEVKFKEECGTDGTGCSAYATATSNDVVAFCQTPSGIARRLCSPATPVTFVGVSQGCDPKHPQDGTFTDGVGHAHHGCTATFRLVPVGGVECCQAGEFLRDVTPIEMDTTLVANYAFPSGGDIAVTQEAPPSEEPGTSCSSDSTFSQCSVQQHCSINPKKIVFIDPSNPNLSLSREYQCNITSVTNGAIIEPPCIDCEID